ncbi:MAG: copper amine oxidase N-terminal domain-containing protein [Bacillota bacterium]
MLKATASGFLQTTCTGGLSGITRNPFCSLSLFQRQGCCSGTEPRRLWTVIKERTSLCFTAGAGTVYRNGDRVHLEVAPRIVKGRTFVPLRFVVEALGAAVDWDGVTPDRYGRRRRTEACTSEA